jgi:hypothetical protein
VEEVAGLEEEGSPAVEEGVGGVSASPAKAGAATKAADKRATERTELFTKRRDDSRKDDRVPSLAITEPPEIMSHGRRLPLCHPILRVAMALSYASPVPEAFQESFRPHSLFIKILR